MAASRIRQFTKIEMEVYNDCPVCTEPITIESAFMVTVCCHVMHADCLLTWCLNQPSDIKTCPVCRASMELKGFEAYLKRARRTVAEAASLMIPHVVDHLEQAIRASTEAERHQESHPER